MSGTPLEQFQDTKLESNKENMQKADKQTPLTKTKEANPTQDKLCDAQGIEEIPQLADRPKPTGLPQNMAENCKNTIKLLALLKKAVVKAEEQHKKGIKVSAHDQNKTLMPNKGRLKPLPGLEYLEQLDEKEPMRSLDNMIV